MARDTGVPRAPLLGTVLTRKDHFDPRGLLTAISSTTL